MALFDGGVITNKAQTSLLYKYIIKTDDAIIPN